jgi:hypothetical protein
LTNETIVFRLLVSRLSCEERKRKTKKKERKMAEKKEMGYCVKCRAKSEFKNAKQVKMKNGRPALKGTCAKCGTGMYKILASKKK